MEEESPLTHHLGRHDVAELQKRTEEMLNKTQGCIATSEQVNEILRERLRQSERIIAAAYRVLAESSSGT